MIEEAHHMQAVILAGGNGTRLHPLTMGTPKPLLPLFGKPVLEHAIDLLRRHGVTDIIMALSRGAEADIVEHFDDGSEWGVSIRYSLEDEPKGTAGAVKLVQSFMHGTFLVVSGDVVCDFDLSSAIEFHKRKSALATLLLHEVDDPCDFGLVNNEPDGRITRILEKPRSSDIFTKTINAGIYILEPESLSSVPYFSTCDFARDLFPRLLNNMEPVYGCRPSGYWCDVGNLLQYRNVHFDALLGKTQIDIEATQVEPGVWIGDGAEIHDTAELAGPVFLGPGAELRKNAELRPFAVVGENSLVDEAACVTRSIVGNRAFIGKGTRVTDCVIESGYRVQESQQLKNRVVMEEFEESPATILSKEKVSVSSDMTSMSF
jgi:mannose-1-phosphate guanylyltransferase / phosphomannomutase